jgi:hypothetical protein
VRIVERAGDGNGARRDKAEKGAAAMEMRAGEGVNCTGGNGKSVELLSFRMATHVCVRVLHFDVAVVFAVGG